MPRYDFRTPRLYVDSPLGGGTSVGLDAAQAHYLRDVLRLKGGDGVLVFNGRDGEWRARIVEASKRKQLLEIEKQTRTQTSALDLHYLFAPLRHARLDYLTQKAVEMGVSRLQPVMTRHGQVRRVNAERMRANAIEAAEQCGILTVPDIEPLRPLGDVIAARDPGRVLVFCDEDAEVKDPIATLSAARVSDRNAPMPIAVLVGPEGGFAADERAALMQLPNTVRLALGPRVLRADTAAVAALALVGAVLGDWR